MLITPDARYLTELGRLRAQAAHLGHSAIEQAITALIGKKKARADNTGGWDALDTQRDDHYEESYHKTRRNCNR